MKNFQDKLQDFNKTNFSGLFYEFGFTPNDLRYLIVEEFEDYFQNKNNLKRYAINDLVTIWFSFLTIKRDYNDTIKYITIILEIYNSAKDINKELVFNAYAKWLLDFTQSITRFWSFYNGQKEYDELCDEDYLSEILQLIGQAIEGTAKPYLQFTLYLNRIKRRRQSEIEDIKSKDLGSIIDELITTSELNEALIIHNIRLNQWRNIAYHHNSKIVDGKMFYYLKRNGIVEEYEITREELRDIIRSINNLFKLIRIAETIFFVDNYEEIEAKIRLSDISQINQRKEAELVNFNYSISSQGFNVTNLEYDENNAKLDLIDLESYSDITKKAIHSSQFLYNLWLLTESKHLMVNYYLFNGTKYFTSEVSSHNFENSTNDVPFQELMKDVKFTYINSDIKQDVDPFNNLNFTEEIVKNAPQFYSQAGEPISISEFTKQFILTIFCNYLALKAEGFNDIKLNLGSDGGMIMAEKPLTIVLMVPATIKSKAFQDKLSEVLNDTIQLYENNSLILDVVNDAKSNNDYYKKIFLIKEKKKNVA